MQGDSSVYCSQGPTYIAATQQGALSKMRFVFKDLFDVEGYTTGAGNPKWLETHVPSSQTSPLISALLAGGADCAGRVQTDELAYSLNGENIHYGTPLNPIAPDCLPGGSSSGCAVAVARGDVDFAIGTDTGGSVRVPASYCGLYGLRPTQGTFSLDHCFELASSFDTAGLFSQDLATLQLVYRHLDKASATPSIAQTLVVDRSLFSLLGDERWLTLKQWCQSASIKIENVDSLAESGYQLAELSLLFRQIQGYEIIATHGEWLNDWGHTLAPAIQERVVWAKTISSEQYHQAKAQQATFTSWLHCQLQASGVLWALPTTPGGPPPLTMPSTALAQYRSDLMGLTSLAGLSGMPQLHLPMANIRNEPCGISLLGLPHSEMDLMTTATSLVLGGAV